MQNKCNNGCGTSAGCSTGFVPVSSNWDFNMNGTCGCQTNRRTKACNECSTRNRSAERNQAKAACQCERCDDPRTAECCDRNTYIRERETDCGCAQRTQTAGCTGKANCTCEQCMNRSHNRSACCKSGDDNGYGRGRNHHVGMINAPIQEIEELFESESALRAGTLFPELHKPMNGYCPYDCYCGTCAQEAAFAAWELRLYLDTHPHDEKALALFRKLCKEAEEDNYATTFLPDDCCTECWNWVKNPWPWEYSCQCGD